MTNTQYPMSGAVVAVFAVFAATISGYRYRYRNRFRYRV